MTTRKQIFQWPVIVLWLAFLVTGAPQCKKGSGGGTSQPTPPPAANTFRNPLLSSGPDPYVHRQGSTYYYTHTMGDRISLWRTTAMSKIAMAAPTTIYTPPATGPNSRNLWAPELHRINNKWYVYYTAGDGTSATGDPFATQRTWVLENSSDDPLQGTWTDKGRIFDPANDRWAIDGTVMELNGNYYFLWSGRDGTVNDKQNIYIAPMSNPWTISGPRSMISTPTLNWEKIGFPEVNEGPEVLKNPAGKVFVIYSASGCWTDDYALGMLTLRDGGNPMNPADWSKSPNPVFQKNVANSVYGPGHNSFFTSPNGQEHWIIYHANSQPMNNNGCGNSRSPRMQKFTFNGDGTPNFGVPVSTSTSLTIPAGE
jgi:GH43 family beta-xylosidase